MIARVFPSTWHRSTNERRRGCSRRWRGRSARCRGSRFGRCRRRLWGGRKRIYESGAVYWVSDTWRRNMQRGLVLNLGLDVVFLPRRSAGMHTRLGGRMYIGGKWDDRDDRTRRCIFSPGRRGGRGTVQREGGWYWTLSKDEEDGVFPPVSSWSCVVEDATSVRRMDRWQSR
ncbi:hypothetical protein C8R45DRAFT_1212962 [Mycena sanguinolenta]|nr:hypothetical protein C8R45DRAFT_1212962 [Mycena sanguinolenta]